MDKKEKAKESCVDVTRESLIEIAYQVPESVAGEEVVDPLTHDGQEIYRSKLISISYSSLPEAKLLQVSPVQPNGFHG